MEKYLADFTNSVKKNYPKNKDKILYALEFATKAHDGVLRKSGEPYIIHPIQVSQILIDNNMDFSTVIAGLLHDVVEDTKITIEQIEKEFGKVVAKLVDGVTKIDSVTLKKDGLTEDDSIKRLLIAMGDDVRVIFIKLADRLHNMRTIEYLSKEKQIAMARQTRDLFVPIAERIGVRNIRSELQSLAFEWADKESYEKIKIEQDRKIEKHKQAIEKINNSLKSVLKSSGMNFQLSWWPEKYYSIYKKLNSQGVNKAYGLVIFKIIVSKVEDCYKAMGAVHQKFKPVPSQIKDYIASPKPNGYQSIHTIVMSDEITFSVMIRTKEMDDVCEYGILAYENSKDSTEGFNKKLEKLNRLKEIIYDESQDDFIDSASFIDAIKSDLSANVTWVLTPKAKPIKLDVLEPTAIDFAYAVGDDIAKSAVGVVVNGKKSSLETILKTGDVVEIVTAKNNKIPYKKWLRIAKTPYARQKIRESMAQIAIKDTYFN